MGSTFESDQFCCTVRQFVHKMCAHAFLSVNVPF